MTTDRREAFRRLHTNGCFVMPNAWDVGSAKILLERFPAVATTSSGHAATLGKQDQEVTRDELLEHVALISSAIDAPLSVDSERCFGDGPAGVAETVELLAGTDAAGCSIEDYDPAIGGLDDISTSTERVGAAAEVAGAHGLVLTARAENHLYGASDLDDTINRLRAYRDAGADVVYAPGLLAIDDIARVVGELDHPINVLARPNGPSIPELAAVGVRRVSTGGALTNAAYGALRLAAEELAGPGTSTYAKTH